MNSDSNHFCNFILLRVSQQHIYFVFVWNVRILFETQRQINGHADPSGC